MVFEGRGTIGLRTTLANSRKMWNAGKVDAPATTSGAMGSSKSPITCFVIVEASERVWKSPTFDSRSRDAARPELDQKFFKFKNCSHWTNIHARTLTHSLPRLCHTLHHLARAPTS